MKIGFIGLGKLGSEVAEYMAEFHDVYGYDIEERRPDGVNVVDNIQNTVVGMDFTFIAVPTPHDKEYDGSKPTTHLPPKDFDYSHVEYVLKQLSMFGHSSTIVLISTVLPGTIRQRFLRYVNKEKFIYNPYLIAMGTVKEDMENPEMIIIGNETGNTDGETEKLIEFYNGMSRRKLRFEIGTFDEAESIKIFYNTFISMKIGLANMVLDVAQINGNIDSDVVMRALARSNMRLISPFYLKPGMGDGGPCHPRDNIALRFLSKNYGLGYDLFGSIMEIRERQAYNIAQLISDWNLPLVILGKSYKPNVDLIDGSYSLLVGHYFEEITGEKPYYDVEPECDGDVIYLLAHLKPYDTYKFRKGSVIFDPWGIMKPRDEVYYYGRNI
jgi:UDPglucose 6-dehydrogenase